MIIKVGIIGSGLSANNYHIPYIKSHDNFQLTNALTSKCKSPEDFYTADFNLAVITTPNFLHYEQARKCLQNNKHVLIEKPFTLTLREAEDLYNLAEKKGLTVNPYFNRRYDRDFLFLQSEIKKNPQNQVLTFESNWDKFVPERNHVKWKFLDLPGSGLYYDISPHLIDQALQLFGNPLSVFAEIKSLKSTSLACDYFSCSLQYDDKVVHLNSSGHGLIQRERFRLCLPGQTIVTYGQDTHDQKINDDGLSSCYAEIRSLDQVLIKTAFAPTDYHDFYDDLWKAISRNDYLVRIEDCLNNVKIMQTLQESSYQNKTINYLCI